MIRDVYRQSVAGDDADIEAQRIDAFDAVEVNAVHAQVVQVVVRRKVCSRDVGRRQHRTPSHAKRAVAPSTGLYLGAAE